MGMYDGIENYKINILINEDTLLINDKQKRVSTLDHLVIDILLVS